MAEKKNMFPPGLVSNLQSALASRNRAPEPDKPESDDPIPAASPDPDAAKCPKPVVLVTNGDGIESPGLTFLVQALVDEGLYEVSVCAPQLDKSLSGHSVTFGETVAVTSTDINGATAFEVSGTPADCVSLALSGALFSWSKPLLVISGIDKGPSCGHHMVYSGVVAGAREALLCGVPSISISLNWRKDQSQESDFKDAVSVCLPLINAAVRDIESGAFPKGCLLNVEVPASPLTNKGFKLARQSLWRSTPNWLAVSTNRGANFMSNQQSLGLQLAQLGRDASAAGAARRLATQKKNLVEVESVGVAGKPEFNKVKKYFKLEFLVKDQDDADEDLDFRAADNGFIAVTPISVLPRIDSDSQTAASDWISAALNITQ
uniref:Survival protein SurE-like phosphatase/nucleotidase domain-containing protein n=1 Tax=Kalanchoe fedtschenkoi TaxID=63787 RepID=A0A7N0RIM9_KALFE